MKKHTLLQRLLPLAMLAAMLLSAVPAAAAFRDTAGHWAAETLSARTPSRTPRPSPCGQRAAWAQPRRPVT